MIDDTMLTCHRLDGMLSALAVEVFTQEMAGFGIDQTNVDFIPLHTHLRRAIRLGGAP